MIVTSLEIPDLKLIEPARHVDTRGHFSEVYSAREFARHGIDAVFVQDNHSVSHQAGTIRGLHFQSPPHAQGKLVRVVSGLVVDVAVDMRTQSSTFGQHVCVELSAENGRQLWVPEGFAHGFCTLVPDTEVLYKVTEFYHPQSDLGVAFDDPELAIKWPEVGLDYAMSDKDRHLPKLSDLRPYF
ncbi:dTDP-4-dehydrorhamnose 3,5-epimerase [Tepidamorphus sp. 3E244]|uniref:dTDP-4-dehydrorhamnose 3,5-epimerase n=1 Tax=Tepidamorphus sp. 3E244 TaxID=3385498 RepID=UPI0038FC3408